MPRAFAIGALFLACVAANLPTGLHAQAPTLVLPRASQRAAVAQTVGLTEIAITYDRPAVKGREVWGKLVPYDSVWRAGANENTVIEFSSPVRVGGKPLPAGRYGVHMIPTTKEWTVILSHQANAWGSFSYDAGEDAVRLTAAPVEAPFQEALAYTLDDPGTGSVIATMRWEKLAVPFTVEVDYKKVVVDSLRQQLRGLGRFFWQPWMQAAAWCAGNDVNLEEASEWAQRSIAINENFANLRVKATLLEKLGDAANAATLRGRAFELATEADMNTYGYQLLGEGKVDSAIAVFKKNVKDYPKSWNVYDSLGEAYAMKGDKRRAIELYSKARSMTKDPTQQERISGVLAGLR
jgi:tetratricopeptide (TPR) repeat protein